MPAFERIQWNRSTVIFEKRGAAGVSRSPASRRAKLALILVVLSADDSSHAVAYDAVLITVSQAIALTISRVGTNLNLTWSGGSPPYAVERKGSTLMGTRETLVTRNGQSALVPMSAGSRFLRVRGQ